MQFTTGGMYVFSNFKRSFCANVLRGSQFSQTGATSFVSSRDDDDINDVASMAGVNLLEESARIMATNSELVGAVTRSCKDETFLSTSSLSRRALEIGETCDLFHRKKRMCCVLTCVSKTSFKNV